MNAFHPLLPSTPFQQCLLLAGGLWVSTAAGEALAAVPSPSSATQAAFAAWSDRYQKAVNGREREALVAEGVRLAVARRSALRELIQKNPRQALAEALPAEARQHLPVEVLERLEQAVSGRGFYGVLIADYFDEAGEARLEVRREVVMGGKRYQAFVYGNRLRQMTRPDTLLSGVAVDDLIALYDEPSPGEGGGAEGDEPPTLPDSWTQGPKTLLYIRLAFADNPTADPQSETSCYDAINTVNNFFIENSWNTMSLIPTVTPLLVLPQTEQYYKDQGEYVLRTDALELARNQGYDSASYILNAIRYNGGPGSFSGLGYVGGAGIWLKSSSAGVAAHEWGHNLGLRHANFWTATGDSVIGPGSNSEYGDSFDLMGSTASMNNHFNPSMRRQIEWLPEAYVATLTASSTQRIHALDVPLPTPGRTYAVRIRKDPDRDYWLGHRQKFTSNPWLLNGVELHWDPWTDSASGTHLLDTTPGSVPGKNDSAVMLGRTFSDSAADLHVTPIARIGSAADSAIDVVVQIGPFPGNHPPELTLGVNQASVPAGTPVYLTAYASDPDGDALAYYWDFGDNTYGSNSVNSATVARAFNTTGHYTVQCTVSDMKGKVATDSVVITVGSPTTRRITGRILDSYGEPVEGVRITANGTTAGYTDSLGNYHLGRLSSGSHTIAAVKYGYSFGAAGGWVNPVSVSSGDAGGINFIATPGQWVSISARDDYATEAPGNPGAFRLVRSGLLTASLEVALHRSGTATYSSDYTTSVALTGTVSRVTIPAGVSFLDLTVLPVNDTTSEGPEFVELTVWQDAAYAVMGQGVARVNIDDDEVYTKPTVSVSTSGSADNRATESGDDHGYFRVYRTGNVSSNITVFWTIGGTATSGVDYQLMPRSVLLAAGQSEALVPVIAMDDLLVEGDETVTLTLQENAAYTRGTTTAQTVTILDDDPPLVTLSVADATLAEPSDAAQFRVTRTGRKDFNLVVFYSLSGTASNGVDYTTPPGSVTIPAGSASATFTLTPINDSLLEGDETVIVTLQPAVSYNLANPATYTLTLLDNELPTVSVSTPDSTASEPGADTARFVFTRANTSAGDLRVYYSVSGTAINGADYQTLTGEVLMPDGVASVTNIVTPIDDGFCERPETIRIVLSPHSTYNRGSTYTANLTLNDNDAVGPAAIGFAFAESGAIESGGSRKIAVVVSTNAPSALSVNYAVTGGTATGGGVDYTLAAGTLNLNAGTNSTPLTLALVNDSAAEGDETVVVTLSNPVGAVLDAQATHVFTIYDDDINTVALTVTDASASENGPDPGAFVIARAGSTANPLTVLFEVLGTAAAGADYADFGSSATIPAGQSSVTLPVQPVDDATDELNETVELKLVAVPGSGYKLGASTGTVTITDNDNNANLPILSLTATDPLAIEGPVPDVGQFTVTRGTNTTGDLAVYFTVGGSATSGSDYSPLGSSAVISNGLSSVSLLVTPLNNSTAENDETVVLTLSSADNYLVDNPATAIVTMADDDSAVVTVTATDATAAEWGPHSGTFTLTRAVASAAPLTVHCQLGGTAEEGTDYLALPPGILIPPGSTSAVVVVTPAGDDGVAEGDETVILTLAPGSYYTAGTPASATVTIADRPIDAWRFSRFTAAELLDPSVSGDGADPELDGIVNLLEYAFGLEPKSPDATGVPTPTEESGHLAITYRRSKPAIDLDFTVEGCDSLTLTNWDAAGLLELAPADMGGSWQITVRDSSPISNAPARFLRLKVQRQSLPDPP